MARVLLRVPTTAEKGSVIEIRALIQHVMETGYRPDNFGRRITKNVINTLTCRYNGVEVFRAEMGSGVSANPQLQFYVRVDSGGEFIFDWVDDSGQRGSERALIAVTG